jgi:hypothetical protein
MIRVNATEPATPTMSPQEIGTQASRKISPTMRPAHRAKSTVAPEHAEAESNIERCSLHGFFLTVNSGLG